MGPALGGGHGWLEGRYGLVADQFVSMNVVLANGDLKTIDANTDLWWAMRGAGHNYGIVTSVKSKIYDIISPKWSIETIIFSGDKVAAIYDAANKNILQSGNQADDINNWSYWLNSPDLDSQKVSRMLFSNSYMVDHALLTVTCLSPSSSCTSCNRVLTASTPSTPRSSTT